MKQPLRILLQTTIAPTDNDWSIARFSLLDRYLSALKDEIGNPLCEVVARDRQEDADGNDPVLSALEACASSHDDRTNFDELWLFAVDVGDGIGDRDCEGITRFRQQGGGILTTRDHMNLGSSLCSLAGIGAAHFFHTKNPDPDATRHCIDDPYTIDISYPNYHSGRNGDYQQIAGSEPVHPLLVNSQARTGQIEFLPAHPHEGAVGVPTNSHARVIATGKSVVTDRLFNLIVAFVGVAYRR